MLITAGTEVLQLTLHDCIYKNEKMQSLDILLSIAERQSFARSICTFKTFIQEQSRCCCNSEGLLNLGH